MISWIWELFNLLLYIPEISIHIPFLINYDVTYFSYFSYFLLNLMM